MTMFEHMPDWVPFACLVTGRVVRKPMFTRIVEGLIQSAIAAAITLYVGVKVLERDFIYEKEKLATHLVRYELQIIKRDSEIREAKAEVTRGNTEIIRRLESIENCIRTRTCTK